MVDKPVPILLAMIICDSVLHDSKTQRKSVINIFDTIHAPRVPVVCPRLTVFVSVSEGIGDYEGKLVCIAEESGKQIMEINGPLSFANRQQRIEFDFEINGLKFPHFGTYRFDFLCNDKLVRSRKFTVLEVKKEKKQ